MSKFVSKPIYVQAEQYQAGLEDGFMCQHYGKKVCDQVNEPVNVDKDYPACVKCKKSGQFCSKPFVRTSKGDMTVFSDTDYVVSYQDGDKSVFSEKDFRELFNPIWE